MKTVKPKTTVLTTHHSKSREVPSLGFLTRLSQRPAGTEYLQKSWTHGCDAKDPLRVLALRKQLKCSNCGSTQELKLDARSETQRDRESPPDGIGTVFLRFCSTMFTHNLQNFSAHAGRGEETEKPDKVLLASTGGQGKLHIDGIDPALLGDWSIRN